MQERWDTKEALKRTGADPDNISLEQLENILLFPFLLERGFDMALEEEFGPQKTYEIVSKAWYQMGKICYSLLKEKLGLKEVKDIDTLANLIKVGYNNLLNPVTLKEDGKDRKTLHGSMCSFWGFGQMLLGMKATDEICKAWREASNTFIAGIIDSAGLKGIIKGEMIHAMCLGDDEDIIVLEYVK